MMKIAVGISTAERPDLLHKTLGHLRTQTRPPDRTIVSIASFPDAGDPDVLARGGIEVVASERGLTRQRNAILDVVGDCDLVAFFDDDFVPAATYLEAAETLFGMRPGVALATGTVLADGVCGPGLEFAEAVALLGQAGDRRRDASEPERVYNGYGCNMVARMAPIRERRLRFDEELPLYGWLEDVDFSRRLADFGEIVRADSMRGIHLGVKHGRQSGERFGYSQIANPVYLMRKHTMSSGRALWLMARNAGMNLVRGFGPEAYVDRRGRLAGNVRALLDLLRLRLHPRRALDIGTAAVPSRSAIRRDG